MYPYRDPITELCGYAADKTWIVTPAFYYVHPFTHQRAIVQKSEGEYGCLNHDLQFIPLEPLFGSLVKNARIIEVSNLNDNPAEPFAWSLIVEHGQEISFAVLDHELKPTILKTIAKKLDYQFYSDNRWLLLSVRESGKRKHFSFDPQTWEQQALPDFKTYFASADGYWVVAAINERDDPQSEFITLGASDKYAFFSIETLQRISNWYPYASSFSEGLGLLLNSRDQFVFVDSNFKPVEGLVLDHAQPFHQGLTPASRRNRSGYYDKNGKLVIRMDPEIELRRFDRFGHAVIVLPNEQRAIIDRVGNEILSELRSCDLFDGDFPFYEISHEWQNDFESFYYKPDFSRAVEL